MRLSNRENPQDISVAQVVGFLGEGLRIAISKECRMYVILPIFFNFILMSAAGYYLFTYIKDFIFKIIDFWPDYLNFLIFLCYIISGLTAVSLVFVCCYFFSTVATIIASPFYGLLADKVELKLNGTQGADLGFTEILKDIPRIIKREIKKQLFFLPRALLCLIITFVPVVNLAAPVLWFLLTAWMGCLQYCDYAYDNHKIAFAVMKRDLNSNPLATLSFGALISLTLAVPLLNLIVPPAAVCAGTQYYLAFKNLENQEEEFTS